MPLANGEPRVGYSCARSPSPAPPTPLRAPGSLLELMSRPRPLGGRSYPSPHYEGLMTRWMKLQCAIDGANGGIQRITQLKGWDRMGYDVSLEIRTKTGELLSTKKEKALETRCDQRARSGAAWWRARSCRTSCSPT
jgi:hypothetical protein